MSPSLAMTLKEGAGLAAALIESGFQPGVPSLVCCEGLVVYLQQDAVELALAELRSVAAPRDSPRHLLSNVEGR